MPRKIVSNKHKISKELQTCFAGFLEYAVPARLSRNLRNMLLLWLIHEKDSLPDYTDDLLHDLNELFRLLDGVEKSELI
jgi:hypothetical protein